MRRLAPSGFDMQPARAFLSAADSLSSKTHEKLAASPAVESTDTSDSAGAQEEAAAGDAFQRQIPALKRAPDVRAILAGLKEVCRFAAFLPSPSCLSDFVRALPLTRGGNPPASPPPRRGQGGV